jgi:hypothetical protein
VKEKEEEKFLTPLFFHFYFFFYYFLSFQPNAIKHFRDVIHECFNKLECLPLAGLADKSNGVKQEAYSLWST